MKALIKDKTIRENKRVKTEQNNKCYNCRNDSIIIKLIKRNEII